MPRRAPSHDEPAGELQGLLDRLITAGPDGPTLDEQLTFIQGLRQRTPDASSVADRALLAEIHNLRQGLFEARELQSHLKEVLRKLSAPPWHPGVFIGPITTDGTATAMVAVHNTTRAVGLGDGVALDQLSVGDDVLLGRDLNLIVQKADAPVGRAFEIGIVEQHLGDGRLVLKHRDVDVVVQSARMLETVEVVKGDRVRWDPAIGLAFERIERTQDSDLFLEETPIEGFERIGGLDRQVEQIQETLGMHFLHADVAHRYQLPRIASVLLVGPPGVGKTMIARAVANWIGRHTPSRRVRFMNVKPGVLNSMWFGRSEENYRETFRIAREVADAEPGVPVIMFFDEVDAIGATRGATTIRIDDKVLNSFMAELDGLAARGNIVVIAATNRRESMDPGLLRPGRLGDLILDIPRPGMAAAAGILEKHLSASIPYDGQDAGCCGRRSIIDAAVSRLYAPNGEGEVAHITFRDGTRRAIRSSDVVSGASLANIARAATHRACVREIRRGGIGLRIADVLDAIRDQLDQAVAGLTPANCHSFVDGLPQDLAVARVEPVIRKVRRPHAYITAA
jgi:proteasome-associated ATPase